MDISKIDLSGHTAVVTGASRGIGRQISLHLAEAGARVILTARDEKRLQSVKQTIESSGGQAEVIPLDVGDPESVKSVFATIRDRFGAVDLLINNAGIGEGFGNFWEVDPESWWKTMEVNLRGVFLCTREVVPGMIKKGGGRIINLGSGIGAQPFPEASAYCVSKAALFRLGDTMAAGLEGTKVCVFTISPGMVETDMTQELKKEKVLPAKDWTPIEYSGDLCVYLASGKADVLTGRYIHARWDDVEEMVRNADNIIKEDLQMLHMKT